MIAKIMAGVKNEQTNQKWRDNRGIVSEEISSFMRGGIVKIKADLSLPVIKNTF